MKLLSAIKFIWPAFLLLVVGCEQNDAPKPFDCANSDLTISLFSKTSPTQCGSNDGSFSVAVHGGKMPYQFELNDAMATSPSFSGLLNGSYIVIVRDKNSCSDTLLVMLEAIGSQLSVSTTVQQDTDCFSGNGSVQLNASGGQEPYTYSFNHAPFSVENFYSGLEPSVYHAVVRDNQACEFVLGVEVPHGLTGITWENNVKAVFELQCSKSGCHVPGTGRIDFTNFENVMTYKQSIKTSVINRSMPFEGRLTQNEIDLIVCWVDDGAPRE